jgi:hypothetical protein
MCESIQVRSSVCEDPDAESRNNERNALLQTDGSQ